MLGPFFYAAGLSALAILAIYFLATVGKEPTPETIYPPGKYEGTRDGVTWFSITSYTPCTFEEWKQSIPMLKTIRKIE